MSEHADRKRRNFLAFTASGIALMQPVFSTVASARTQENSVIPESSIQKGPLKRLEPLKRVDTDILSISYYEAGPVNGPVAILLHGFPYDIHSFIDVAPMLASKGYRVIVPELRGYGGTHFLSASTQRSGQQAAMGADIIDLMDALKIQKAVLAGYDWGGRAACIVAALWPERCTGLVSVNSYLIQDIAKAGLPLPAHIEWGLWYQYYFQTERGRAGLRANRRDIAKIIWKNNSPTWKFDDATFDRTAKAFDNSDYVDVVIHNYRHRLGLAAGDPRYEEFEKRLAAQPVITVPTVTLDGQADGVIPATDGKSSASKFTNRVHKVLPNVGHNLPQEAPLEFVEAVMQIPARG